MKLHFMIFVTFAALFTAASVVAQETVAEKLLENQEESDEQSELYEILLNLRDHPLDLNSATAEELEVIPGLSLELRQAILQYRKQQGRFESADELLRVPGVDAETFNYLRELVHIPQTQRPRVERGFRLRSRFSDRIDRPVGFDNGSYQFSAPKIYNRIQYQISSKIQGSVVLEKDSGERRWDDLRLYHVQFSASENFSILLGHFLVEIGQGLVLWGPYGFSKGADAVFPIKKRARGFRGYSSVDENAALHGGLVKLAVHNLEATVFASKTKLDATATSDDEVSGLFATGFHRNENEINKRDALSETLAGAAVHYTFPLGIKVGASGYFSKYDKTINDPDLIRQRFAFRGKENTVVGLDWDWRIRSANLFGEFARSKNGALAWLTGAMLGVERAQLALLYRDYAKDFQNQHGFPFADASGATQNERGFYTGLTFKITPRTTLNAYYDIFSHPWRTFFEPLPWEGNEFLSQLEQRFGTQIRITLRFRENNRPEAETFRDELGRDKQEFVATTKRQWRLQMDYTINPRVRVRSRLEYVTYNLNRFAGSSGEASEQGFLMYQDFRIQPTKALTIAGRLTFFDTDSFDSAVFQYENDLPGLVTNRALFGEGARWYVLFTYKYRLFDLSVKYSETFRDDIDVIGSGPDQINGNLDRRIGAQLDVKW